MDEEKKKEHGSEGGGSPGFREEDGLACCILSSKCTSTQHTDNGFFLLANLHSLGRSLVNSYIGYFPGYSASAFFPHALQLNERWLHDKL